MALQQVKAERVSQFQAEAIRFQAEQSIELAQKSYGLSQLAQMFAMGFDSADNKDSKPTRPYSQVELVYACVNKLIAGVQGMPAVISTLDDKIVESGPVWELLFKNPAMSWTKFVTETIGHYALSCDVFWVFTETQGRRPKEIMVVSGTQMHPVTHNRRPNGVLTGWEFRGRNAERAFFSLDECYQWKNFNPYDRFHGIGPATASKYSIDYSFAAALYNASALANGAEPGIILTAPGKLDSEQVNMLGSQFDARHGGASKTKRTAVLTGGMTASTVALKMTDMQVAKIMGISDNKICASFGVPPSLVGLITEAQYSHGPAMRDFIFNTIIPLTKLFAGEATAAIISRFLSADSSKIAKDAEDSNFYRGTNTRLAKKTSFITARQKATMNSNNIFLWFDCDQHPVVQEAKQESTEKILKFTQAGVPLNDLIETHNLPYEQVPWGDDHLVPMGLVPARLLVDASLEDITGPSYTPDNGSEEEESKSVANIITKDDAADRLRLWNNWKMSWSAIEGQYNASMRRFFLRQERELLAKLKLAMNESKDITKADPEQLIARIVFDLRIENGKIKVINQTFFDKASELGIRQALTEVAGLTGDELNSRTEQIKRLPIVKGKLVKSNIRLAKVNETTQLLVAKQLRTGLEAGEGLNELTARVKKTLGSNRARALKIARTQTAGAVGTGRHEGLRAAGTNLKSWVTAGDEHVRNAHVTAGSSYTEGIPVDQPFDVGGEMLMYPADPAGSAANIINCRCVEIAIAGLGKQNTIEQFSNYKFYSYSDILNDQKQSEVKDGS